MSRIGRTPIPLPEGSRCNIAGPEGDRGRPEGRAAPHRGRADPRQRGGRHAGRHAPHRPGPAPRPARPVAHAGRQHGRRASAPASSAGSRSWASATAPSCAGTRWSWPSATRTLLPSSRPRGSSFEVPDADPGRGARHRQAGGRPDRRPDPRGAPAGALQGQGHPLRGRGRPAQGREAGMSTSTLEARQRAGTAASAARRGHRPSGRGWPSSRSNKRIYAQLIDDDRGHTLAAAGRTRPRCAAWPRGRPPARSASCWPSGRSAPAWSGSCSTAAATSTTGA